MSSSSGTVQMPGIATRIWTLMEDKRAIADDREIIPAFLRGDDEAVRIVDAWIQAVLHAEFHALQSEWEDLTQEVRLRVLTSLRAHRFNGSSTLRTYVHRIARYTGVDASRKPHRRRETVGDCDRKPDGLPGVDTAERLLQRDLVERVLEGLAARDRVIVDLVFGQHLSHAEVAGHLGLTPGAVRSLAFCVRERLVRRMRRLLEPTRGDA